MKTKLVSNRNIIDFKSELELACQYRHVQDIKFSTCALGGNVVHYSALVIYDENQTTFHD